MNTTAKTLIELLDAADADAAPDTDTDLVRIVRAGFRVDAVDALMSWARLSLPDIEHLVLSRRQLSQRRKLGRLTAGQSDRLLRVARTLQTAIDTFGDQEKALVWLRRPTVPLGNEAPLTRLDTDEGARQVETLLGRIAHGIAA